MGKKICFVSLNSYGILTGKNVGYVGGAEVDQVLLAKELAKHSFNISFITFSEGRWDQSGREDVDGIRLMKVYCKDDASRLSLLTKSWFMWRAMQKAGADIYFEEGASGIVAFFCYLKRREFIYCIASDRDVIKQSLIGKRFITEIGIRLNSRLATAVVAQNDFQAKTFKQNFAKSCFTIPPAYLPTVQVHKKSQPPVVLWVANIKSLKRPEVFLKLAESIPEARFQMIGGKGSGEPEFYDETKESAAKISNLEFLGFIPFQEISPYFEQASIFVNTSTFEGFPTTFVQAWAASLPIVSLNVDPDGIIHRDKLGFQSKTLEQMTCDVKLLLEDKKLRREMGHNARRYAESEHDIKIVAAKYVKVLEKIGR